MCPLPLKVTIKIPLRGVLLVSPGDQYYTYEFVHQPSHQECISMSERNPATLFRHYTDVYYNNYERFLSELFSDGELCRSRYFVLQSLVLWSQSEATI